MIDKYHRTSLKQSKIYIKRKYLNGELTEQISVGSGIRKGESLFNIVMDEFVNRVCILKEYKMGCQNSVLCRRGNASDVSL